MNHWIIAPVLLPAVLAALSLFAGRNAAGRVLSLLGTFGLLAIAIHLLCTASGAEPQVYRLGDWPAPFGITLVLDRLSALMLLLTASLASLVLIQAIATGWDQRGQRFHALWLFQLMGLNGAFLTGDAFNLFVFFEVLLIASYGLMTHGGTGPRIRAGLQYIAINLVGSTLFLFALATIYAVTGTLNMADLAVKLPQLPQGDHALMRVAAILLMLVFAIKGALVPLHFWLPGTYAAAAGVVAALFAVMTKVGAYAALRFGTMVFPEGLSVTEGLIGPLLLPAGLITLGIGAIGILGARGLPQIAASATLMSMGTVFTAMSGFTPATTAATLYYVIHSTFAGAALFLIADLARARGAEVLASKAPLPGRLAALFMAAAIASAGLPPLSGFPAKLMVLQSQPSTLVWAVILLGTFLAILGLSRAGTALFWKPEGKAAKLPLREAFAPAALIAALIGLTILAGPITAWLAETAQSLHNPTPYIEAHDLPGGAQ
ncbi:monovalent cation/H+ antiporter subunit D [Pseudogemmobacter lacusdianii]|uniref:monovalent cation/H+ antiporter subunit D n=1 Tax=Pseudogemmobacter lacusdianii TaxID=3069608 RepID=UPI0035947784